MVGRTLKSTKGTGKTFQRHFKTHFTKWLCGNEFRSYFTDFMKYGKMEGVSFVLNKSGFATGEFKLQVTMTWKEFLNIPDVSTYRGRSIYIIAEGRLPYCCSYGATRHLGKSYSGKNQAPSPKPITPPKEAVGLEISNQVPSEWIGAAKKGFKAAKQAESPMKLQQKQQQQEKRKQWQGQHQLKQPQYSNRCSNKRRNSNVSYSRGTPATKALAAVGGVATTRFVHGGGGDDCLDPPY